MISVLLNSFQYLQICSCIFICVWIGTLIEIHVGWCKIPIFLGNLTHNPINRWRSLPSLGDSIWNPWNECWLRLQPISYSMDIMDSKWNEDEMVMEWSIPCGFYMHSTWISLDSIWNAGISTLDSMEQSIWIPCNNFNSMVILLESQRDLSTKHSFHCTI